MSQAANILREQAVQLAVDYRVGEARMYRAVAELMESMSGDWLSSEVRNRMRQSLAALERAIEGRP